MDINPPSNEKIEVDKISRKLSEKIAKSLIEGLRHIDPRHYKKLFESSHKEEDDFYKSFFAHQFILRDHLAIDRTMLANESTLLAYVRTGLAITAAGATLLHFSTSPYTDYLSFVLILSGILGLIIGGTRYRHMKKVIMAIRKGKEREEAIKNRKSMTGI